MNNLLKFEFRKLKRQKSFYICLIIMAVMLFITGITYKVLMDHAAVFVQLILRTADRFFRIGFFFGIAFLVLCWIRA